MENLQLKDWLEFTTLLKNKFMSNEEMLDCAREFGMSEKSIKRAELSICISQGIEELKNAELWTTKEMWLVECIKEWKKDLLKLKK